MIYYGLFRVNFKPIYAQRPLKGAVANIIDIDQTPQYAASDLCLYYLPLPLLWDAASGIGLHCIRY